MTLTYDEVRSDVRNYFRARFDLSPLLPDEQVEVIAKAIHYDRNLLQASSIDYLTVILGDFKLLPDSLSVFHQLNIHGEQGEQDNAKWVSSAGAEYVFQSTGLLASGAFRLVTSDLNQGSFNFEPSLGILFPGHVTADIYPWLLWGNTLADDNAWGATAEDRFNARNERYDDSIYPGAVGGAIGEIMDRSVAVLYNVAAIATYAYEKFEGFGGFATVSYAACRSPVGVSLDKGYGFAGDAQQDVYVRIGNIIGGLSNDIIVGSGRANDLSGGQGSDTILGMGGDDTIFGGTGNDLIYGDRRGQFTSGGDDTIRMGVGNDTAYGGAGDDFFVFSASGGATLDGGLGRDTLQFSSGALQASDIAAAFGRLSTDGIEVLDLQNIDLASRATDELDFIFAPSWESPHQFDEVHVASAFAERFNHDVRSSNPMVVYHGQETLTASLFPAATTGRATLFGGNQVQFSDEAELSIASRAFQWFGVPRALWGSDDFATSRLVRSQTLSEVEGGRYVAETVRSTSWLMEEVGENPNLDFDQFRMSYSRNIAQNYYFISDEGGRRELLGTYLTSRQIHTYAFSDHASFADGEGYSFSFGQRLFVGSGGDFWHAQSGHLEYREFEGNTVERWLAFDINAQAPVLAFDEVTGTFSASFGDFV